MNTCNPSNKQVAVGDWIEFQRNGHQAKGKVVTVRQSTVLVELDKPTSKLLKYENNITVVNHKNYSVVNE